MLRFGCFILVACCVQDAVMAQTTSYSGTFVISGKTVPVIMRGGAAKADGSGRYGFNGRGTSAPTFMGDPGISAICNLYEQNSTVKMLVFVTPPGAYGPAWTGRYECTPPLAGSLTMDLVGGYGVWAAAMPATVTLTSGP